MRRKTQIFTFLSLTLIALTLNSIIFVQSWANSELIIASAGSEAPVIDGVKEDLWYAENVNVTYYDFNGRQIALYIQYYEDSVYLLIELKNFQTQQSTESFSIYISSSNSTTSTSFIDKKELIMYNASQKGNESSEFKDYHLDGSNYIEDLNNSISYGVARYGSGVNRIYEYNISRYSTNATENNNLTIGNAYAFKIGFKSGDQTEQISEPLLIQIGPKLISGEGAIGEKKVNWALFSQVMHWIAIGLVGIYGVLLIKNKKKINMVKSDIAKYSKEEK